MDPQTLIEKALAMGRAVSLKLPDGKVVRVSAERTPGVRRPLTPAEKQQAYRARKKSVTGKVTPEPGSVTGVTAVTQKPSLPPSPPGPSPSALTPGTEPARTREADFFEPDAESKPKRETKKFSKPSLPDWQAYGATLHPPFPPTEAERAWNHYEANGWRVGKNPAKDWKACCRTCHATWKLESMPAHRNDATNATPKSFMQQIDRDRVSSPKVPEGQRATSDDVRSVKEALERMTSRDR